MPKRKVIVEVDIHDDKVSSIEDLERNILHQCYGTFRLDFLCPKSILVLIDYEEKVSQGYLDSEYPRTENQKYLFQRIKGESSMIDKNVIARRLARLEKNILKLMGKLEAEKCP